MKSNDIICPEGKELCSYELINHRIKLYDCKNGHSIENIKLNEFENTQCLEWICGNCKNKYSEFYICNQCNMNLCSLCKNNHDKEHNIINYKDKNYICKQHNKSFIQYCENCCEDICSSCLDEHENHSLVAYEDKFSEIKDLRKNMNNLKTVINKFKDNLEQIIIKFQKIMECMDIYYNINNEILTNYEINKNLNYTLLKNLESINQSITNEIKDIKDYYNYGSFPNKLLYLYNEMVGENEEITMCYEPKIDNKENVRIFSDKFVQNNRDICKIIYYDGNTDGVYDLKEYFKDIDSHYNGKDSIIFKLKGINNITDMSSMFEGCNSLIKLPDLSKLNTSNIINMNSMFSKCKSLLLLPDMSNWNTSNVTDMGYIFYECESITSLPDISNWDTSNVNFMNFMFYGCKSLTSLPDISKWNTQNVIFMYSMFNECFLLSSFPDLSKWDTSNVIAMNSMFRKCKSLLSLPDISKWNTTNANRTGYMFEGCNKNSLNIPSKFRE